ncbi:MAG: DUF1460 domain-containing protein [Melioribacteraceae bacterium]|nr:DUF1460 domain-containing protein [Melioribacteraceae bacterium]
MKILKLVFIAVVLLAVSSNMYAQKKMYEMNNTEIDVILQEKSSENLTITERMSYYSELFLGMPYNLTCTGDGQYALYETWPLVNFDSTNCMVFCEHTLALSISDSWDNFFNNLQQIRYKDGMIGMRTRNHYTMADWLPENNWLIDDVTKKVGGNFTKTLTRTISHKKFFEGKGIADLRYVKDDRTITIDYIPFNALKRVKENLQNGDIFAILFAKLDNIFSAHMLMIIEKDGEKFVRESSMSKMTTYDTAIDEWIEKYTDSKKYCGAAFMRVKEELNTPGKIILPWEIKNLK